MAYRNMRYCQSTTENHPVALAYSGCVEDINTHLADEGYSPAAPLFIHNETVIDLDEAEEVYAAIEPRQLRQSMDMTIGLRDRRSSKREMLLVEFKFNMGNPNQLSQVDMTGKVAGSINILGLTTPIHSQYIFIFQPNLVEQARNRMARMIPGIPIAYIAMSIYNLKDIYFD